jgi:hypothetical protein
VQIPEVIKAGLLRKRKEQREGNERRTNEDWDISNNPNVLAKKHCNVVVLGLYPFSIKHFK